MTQGTGQRDLQITQARNLGAVATTLLADYDVRPGVSSDEGHGDQWPQLRARILNAEILVMASPDLARPAVQCGQAGPGADGRHDL